MDLAAALASHPAFRHVSRGDFDDLSYAFSIRDYRPDEVIFAEGAAADTVALVLEGEVAIERRRGAQTVEFARVGPGALVGLIALLGPGRRSATCRAVGRAKVATAPSSAFSLLFHGQSPLALAVQEALAAQLAEDFRRASEHAIDALARGPG